MDWKTVLRPGHIGSKRDEYFKIWDDIYGKDNWRLSWDWGNNALDKSLAYQIYEDGYYEHFVANPNILNWLACTASDVYDDSISNVNSGLDYNIQETKSTHLQDIAIRRAVLRLGTSLQGDHLMHVRGKNSEGSRLCPYMIPFHQAQMIYSGQIENLSGKGEWWKRIGVEKSVEEWYQGNKLLQIRVTD